MIEEKRDNTLHVISLGAGVQSSTLALMAAAGEVTPMPACAIFADTQNEPKAVYDWLAWLEKQLPFPVHRVTAGNLWKSATTVRTTIDGTRKYLSGGVPVYFKAKDGTELTSRKGLARRQCTRNFKIRPIQRKLRELAGIKRARKDSAPLVTMWIGISADEAHRAKPSQEPWVLRRHPLLDMGIEREDCFDWMQARGFPRPPRSACVFCPFHDDESWLALTPEELKDAARFEKDLQRAYGKLVQIDHVPYLHAKRIPILEVKFEEKKPGPARLVRKFAPECEGMCGL